MERTEIKDGPPGERAQAKRETRREEKRQSNPRDLAKQDQSHWESTGMASAAANRFDRLHTHGDTPSGRAKAAGVNVKYVEIPLIG